MYDLIYKKINKQNLFHPGLFFSISRCSKCFIKKNNTKNFFWFFLNCRRWFFLGFLFDVLCIFLFFCVWIWKNSLVFLRFVRKVFLYKEDNANKKNWSRVFKAFVSLRRLYVNYDIMISLLYICFLFCLLILCFCMYFVVVVGWLMICLRFRDFSLFTIPYPCWVLGAICPLAHIPRAPKRLVCRACP